MNSQDEPLLQLKLLIERDCPKFDLVNKYICPALLRFIVLGLPRNGRAILLFANGDPERLQYRLNHILDRNALILDQIIKEAGLESIPNADELDRRLMDVWAELRTVSQLLREGFADIRKHRDYYDFDAELNSAPFAIQTVRISAKFVFPQLYGEVPRIRSDLLKGVVTLEDELGKPLQKSRSVEDVFWKRVQVKSSSFAKVNTPSLRRRLVIVTSKGEFSDNFLRYCVCQMLVGFLSCPEIRHIDEICWLPDLGNGYMVSRIRDGSKGYVGVEAAGSTLLLGEPTSCIWDELALGEDWPPPNFI